MSSSPNVLPLRGIQRAVEKGLVPAALSVVRTLPALTGGKKYLIQALGQSNMYTGGTNLKAPMFGYAGTYAEQDTVTAVKKSTSGAGFADLKIGTTWSGGATAFTRSGTVGTISHTGTMTEVWGQAWPSTDSFSSAAQVDTSSFTIDVVAGGIFADPASLLFAGREIKVQFATAGKISATISNVNQVGDTITVTVSGTPFPNPAESVTRLELLSIPLLVSGANESEFNGLFEGYQTNSGNTLVRMTDSGATAATGTMSLILAQQHGFWVHLAKNADYAATTPVYLSIDGQGGTELLDFFPGETSAHGNDIEQEFLDNVNAATAVANVVPMQIFHQGEDSATAGLYAAHPRKVVAFRNYLINRMKPALTGTPHFVAGELLEGSRNITNTPYHDEINAGLAGIVSTADRIHLVESTGQTDIGDYVHFDYPGQVEMGKRYFEKLASLTHDAVLSGSTYGPNLIDNGEFYFGYGGFVAESGIASITHEDTTEDDFNATGKQFLKKLTIVSSATNSARIGLSTPYKVPLTNGADYYVSAWIKYTPVSSGQGTIFLDAFSNTNFLFTTGGTWLRQINTVLTASSTSLNFRVYTNGPGSQGSVGDKVEIIGLQVRAV